MQAIHRKALRDLWLMRGQALAIALVIASGIAMLVMSQSTLESLRDTRALLYQQYRFSDVWAQVKRAPEHVAERVATLPGVAEVEMRVITSGKLQVPRFGEPAEALVLSLPLSLPLAALTWPAAPQSTAAWGALGYVAVFSMWLGFFAWYRGLALGGTVRVSQVQLVQPFLGMLFAVPLLGEGLDAVSVGFGLAVMATVLLGRRMPVRARAPQG